MTGLEPTTHCLISNMWWWKLCYQVSYPVNLKRSLYINLYNRWVFLLVCYALSKRTCLLDIWEYRHYYSRVFNDIFCPNAEAWWIWLISWRVVVVYNSILISWLFTFSNQLSYSHMSFYFKSYWVLRHNRFNLSAEELLLFTTAN